MIRKIIKYSRKKFNTIGISITHALKKLCSSAKKLLHLFIKKIKCFFKSCYEIIKKIISFIFLLIFGRQYKIQKDLARLAKEIQRSKSIIAQEKDLEIMISIRDYYNSIKFESYEVFYQRLEYLSYKKNMLNGMVSGVVASFIFFVIQYLVASSPSTLKEVFNRTDSILGKLILYFFLLILFILIIVIPAFLFIKFILIYCFRVFFNYRKSYFDIYERKIIEATINKRLDRKAEI